MRELYGKGPHLAHTFFRFLVMGLVTDCEECNKKALLALNPSAKNKTLPAELSLVVALPDVVHLGKSLKCNWANWFINFEGARSNLVLIRTLRDSGSLDIRRKLRGSASPSIKSETRSHGS